MTAAHQLAWGLLLVPACFHPSYDHPACGPNGECPGGWTCNAQQICDKDSSAIDASVGTQDVDGAVGPPIDGGPGLTCYGPAGWQACFNAAPTGDVMLPLTINTDLGTPCLFTQPMVWGDPQPAACFIVGDTITVPSGGTNVNGRKPLVLVAKTSIKVIGVLDIASHRGDTATGPSECQTISPDPGMPDASNTSIGGGGGAGGSFMTRAGNGGQGDGGIQNGVSIPADMMGPTHLRGGCPGQAGGALAAGDAGKVGIGGGSVYLLSGGDVALQAAINASGAGGEGGNKRAGGSGGGSGGMIVLYGATITISAAPVLMARGGGGGGGAQSSQAPSGSDPSLTLPLQPASGGGNGGKGYPGLVANDLDGAAGINSGGGGGGGAAGYIRSNKPLNGATVSPPATIVP